MRREPRDVVSGSPFKDLEPDQWAATPTLEPLDVAEAWLQFRWAKTVWASVGTGRLTIQQVADWLGTDYETQRRKLQGVIPASCRDIAAWVALGDQSVLPPAGLGDSFPPTYAPWLRSWSPGSVPAFVRGTAPLDTIRWGDVAQEVSTQLEELQSTGLGSLLSRSVLRHMVSRALLVAGLTSEDLSVDGEGPWLAIEGSSTLRIFCGGGPWSFGTDGRQDRLDETFSAVARAISESAHGGGEESVLCLAIPRRALHRLERLAPGLRDAADGERIEVGPAEVEGVPVWTSQAVAARLIARTSGSVQVVLLAVGKPTHL